MKKTFTLQASVLFLVLYSAFAASNPSIHKSGASPICFTENRGQWDEDVRFRCDAGDAVVWICKDQVVYQFVRRAQSIESNIDFKSTGTSSPLDYSAESVEQMLITARFVGSNPEVISAGQDMLDYKCNYFLGNDQGRWQADVPSYQSATLRDAYLGVDISFFAGDDGRLNYRYDLANPAAGEQVKINYEGIETVATAELGRFIADTRFGKIAGLIGNPAAAKSPSLVRLSNSNVIEPPFDSYESNLRSPQAVSLIYSTFLGGSSSDFSVGVAIDEDGNAYVAGSTISANFPTQDPYDPTYDGSVGDAVVSKMSPDGALIFSTYLGGSNLDAAKSIAVDSANFAYITGSTLSVNFPTQNAYDASNNSSQDAFVTKLTAAGNALIYSTYLGGTSTDTGTRIEVDRFGSVYLAGETISSDFPTMNPYDASLNSNRDVFMTKLSSAGNTLVYSTYLGGSGTDLPQSLAVDDSGAAYMAGQTNSTDFPTQNAYDASYNGSTSDAIVTKISPEGNTLVYSTYLGGTAADYAVGIALDASRNVYVTGRTLSFNFPTMNAYDSISNGSDDVFVSKFSSAGNTLLYSTFLGGTASDVGMDIEIDGSGSPCIYGYTSSSNFPTQNAYDSTANGSADVFVTKLAIGGNALVYSTYLGGTSFDSGIDMEVSLSGDLYLCGYTQSTNFPRVNAMDTTLGGFQDCFVAKLSAEGNAMVGDCDQNGQIDITDAVFLVNYIFAGGPAPSLTAGDSDCNLQIDVTDAVYLVNYIFAGGPTPGTACR